MKEITRMNGVILAGGQATRLGMIGAQMNKSLVTIGQKPTIVRHIQQLLDMGCSPITVVVSPRTHEQVREVIDRAGIPSVKLVTQVSPTGPGGALKMATAKMTGSVVLLMADTLLSDEDMRKLILRDSAAVLQAPSERSWTYWVQQDEDWEEGVAPEGTTVSVGAFHFADARHLHEMCNAQMETDLKMATVCNAYGPLRQVVTESWQDIGDLPALALAQRQRFMSRGHHKMMIDDRGVLEKEGASDAEVHAVSNPPRGARHLYPTVYASGYREGKAWDRASNWYDMEYLDIPSLAEQWLYWPGLPETWHYITTALVGQLENHHWDRDLFRDHGAVLIKPQAEIMYRDKLMKRWADPAIAEKVHAWTPENSVLVNTRLAMAGDALITDVAGVMQHFIDTADQFQGNIHGDTYFGNVLFSPRTGIFKLLDPRGSWGGRMSVGDVRYDLGKISFSAILAPIAHHLFDLGQTGAEYNVRVWTDRSAESQAVDDALTDTGLVTQEELDVLKTYFLLSSAPLHDEPEASAMYLTAVELWDSLSH